MRINKGDLPKPKKGQVWRNKQDGLEILIVGTHGDNMFRTVNLLNRKIQHHVTRKTFWLYYDIMGTESKHG